SAPRDRTASSRRAAAPRCCRAAAQCGSSPGRISPERCGSRCRRWFRWPWELTLSQHPRSSFPLFGGHPVNTKRAWGRTMPQHIGRGLLDRPLEAGDDTRGLIVGIIQYSELRPILTLQLQDIARLLWGGDLVAELLDHPPDLGDLFGVALGELPAA